MDVNSLLYELTVINNEEKQLRTQIKKLRDRKKNIESELIKILNNSEDKGFKYNNLIVVLDNKETYIYKKKSEKIQEAKNILKRHGVTNSENILIDVLKAMKGDTKIQSKLVVKKNK